MSGQQDQPTITLTLPVGDWQLVLNICQQALLPYQRLGQVLQDMQRQAQEAQHPGRAGQEEETERLLQQARRPREVAP